MNWLRIGLFVLFALSLIGHLLQLAGELSREYTPGELAGNVVIEVIAMLAIVGLWR